MLVSFHDPKIDIPFSLILSDAAFTSSSQEIQGNLFTNPGTNSELVCKFILQTSNCYLLACPPSIGWIIQSISHARLYNSSFFTTSPCSSWLQLWWSKSETGEYFFFSRFYNTITSIGYSDPCFSFRHKNHQTTVCSPFRLESSLKRKRKEDHRLNLPYYLMMLRPSCRKRFIFYIKISAN